MSSSLNALAFYIILSVRISEIIVIYIYNGNKIGKVEKLLRIKI